MSFQSHQFLDADGNPSGGHTFGTGFAIAWQNGPLGRGVDRAEPNGAFVEDIIEAAINRLEHFERSKFACAANAIAIDHLQRSLFALNERMAKREACGIEGTHEVDK